MEPMTVAKLVPVFEAEQTLNVIHTWLAETPGRYVELTRDHCKLCDPTIGTVVGGGDTFSEMLLDAYRQFAWMKHVLYQGSAPSGSVAAH